MAAEQQKSIFIRFNMDDKSDRELYAKLAGEAGNSASLTSYAKMVLEEHFTLNIKIADRQEFHRQMLSAVREEMQSQGMKLVGALLSGISMGNVPVQRVDAAQSGVALPDACEKLPDELSGVLDLIR